MKNKPSTRNLSFVPVLVALAVLTACNLQTQPGAKTQSPTPVAPTVIQPTATPLPTPTPIPAAEVNGELISMDEYQAEVQRMQAALGTEMATNHEKDVLDDLINQTLLAQAAAENGFQLDDKALQERIDNLEPSRQKFQAWLDAHGYTQESIKKALGRAIAAAWMRDKIAESVPEATEQVHARQIFLYDEDTANAVYAKLQNGTSFEKLAKAYDPVTKGDLGWFPRGFLLQKELDPVVFSLEEGSYSKVIKTDVGFHIIQVIERSKERRLNYDALKRLRHKAVEDWLKNKREQSKIIVNLP